MKQEDLIKLLLIGVGGYLVWVYVIQPMMAQQQSAAGTPAGTPLLNPVTQPNQPAATPPVQTTAPNAAQLQAQLQKLAATLMLTPDQWAYYYHQIPGHASLITPSQMETILSKLGLTDATRATNVTSAQFVQALNATGLSGIVPSWQASGGPAFSAFVPQATFAGGFSGVNRGFRAAPGKWVQ